MGRYVRLRPACPTLDSLLLWRGTVVPTSSNLVIRRTTLGRRFVATGTNPRAAFAAGIRVARQELGTYVVAARLETDAIGDGYATTYYPGTRSSSEARRFAISRQHRPKNCFLEVEIR